jgi:hypothetical protein
MMGAEVVVGYDMRRGKLGRFYVYSLLLPRSGRKEGM